MGESLEGQRRILIITALSLEAREVQSHLTHLGYLQPSSDSQYELWEFQDSRGSCEVILKESGQLNKVCSAVTTRAILETRPTLALLIGVAGSIRDAVPGDIVVPDVIYDYESGKAAIQFLPRPRTYRPDPYLLDLARSIARLEGWQQRLPVQPEPRPICHTRPLVAGDSLLASRRSELYRLIRTYYSDAVAVAMEDVGFMEATHRTSTPAIVVRGISDQIDDKPERDAQGYQRQAVAHANAFALELVAQWLALSSHTQSAAKTLSAAQEANAATDPPASPSWPIFLQQLLGYKEQLNAALRVLSTSKVIYKDQCRYYFQQLQQLAGLLQQVSMAPPADRALRLRLKNLADAVRQLQQAVEHLRRCSPPGDSRQEQRAYETALQHTLQALQCALQCLERLGESLEKRPL
uniref:Nucleoside phosphorylase domain-containing protein n=1 Tax=Thermogemmatispora argillosa TaxID=2045280 RepID=A0A455SY23_9CHLR|nr:hypothetical protein KTA_14560 [Thermogemmatispora argillosa]